LKNSNSTYLLEAGKTEGLGGYFKRLINQQSGKNNTKHVDEA
jgi:hypothetical protein